MMGFWLVLFLSHFSGASIAETKIATVRGTPDFQLAGDGSNPQWAKASWETLSTRSPNRTEVSRFKVLYSELGLYVLFQAEDKVLTANQKQDFSELWKEDVFEAFIQPQEKTPIYLEYEISPLGTETALLVPNLAGKVQGWMPFAYSGARRTRRATSVQGGKKEPASRVSGWTAEVFLPYALFNPLENVPPKPGTKWRANFYRMDYDAGQAQWDWARVGKTFHDPKNFGVLSFE